jgi:hypothetical protein
MYQHRVTNCQRADSQCQRALHLDESSPNHREQSQPVAGKKLQAKDMRVIMLMRSPVLGGENTGLLNFESAKDLAKLHAIPDTTTEDLGCRDLHAKMRNGTSVGLLDSACCLNVLSDLISG